jgi:hypothetical protein
MLEERIFGSAVFLGSLLFIFHGSILLIAPGRYLPMGTWGESTLKLVRKPPFEFWKRFAGLCLSVAVFIILTLPGFSMILHPKPGNLSFGNSPLPPDSVRWDLLGFGLFALVSGYLLVLRPGRSVEMLFSSDKSKLEDKMTQKLWKLYVQTAGYFFLVWSLLPLSQFIKSFR